MIQRPKHLAPENATAFQDRSVAEAYRYRPPYPAEVFEILASLIGGSPRHVLDVGCDTGNIARYLAAQVERLDAVDFSLAMISRGKELPGGQHPHLRWLHGPAESVQLEPPYTLIIAGESLHWMAWQIVLPRFKELLLPGGYLALVQQEVAPDPWSQLREILPYYRTDGGYQPFDLIPTLAQHGLFRKVDERSTAPVLFEQSIEDYIESYHARSGFSRERMGPERARAFDQEARRLLLRDYPQGRVELEAKGRVVWGLPV